MVFKIKGSEDLKVQPEVLPKAFLPFALLFVRLYLL